MKSMRITLICCALTTLVAAAVTNDPVIMTIGGKDVKLSEFEYLYNKNNLQQHDKQPVDKYVDMFVNYKLKVADAEAAGLDTTETFRNEMAKYAAELAEPYFVNEAVIDSLEHVAYNHTRYDVDVSHIMLPLRDSNRDFKGQQMLLDSLRNEILAGADFAQMALQYSVDPSVKRNGGHLGYITEGVLPYEFEDAAYSTPIGEVSKVFETQFGHHIVKVHGARPNKGEVKVRHIVKMTRGLSDEQAAVKKHQIDSIYEVLKGGADFLAVAKEETDEPQGRHSGGELPWFGTGRMVPEFEIMAFQTPVGEISKPFQTPFGWHILIVEDRKPTFTFEEKKSQIESRIKNDSRGRISERKSLDKYRDRLPVTINAEGLEAIKGVIEAENGFNQTSAGVISEMELPILTIGDKTYLAKEFAKSFQPFNIPDVRMAKEYIDETLADYSERMLKQQVIAHLSELETDYANLYNEYHDGILLYEKSNAEVWNRANTDTEGLKAFFESHRNNYKWDNPKFKGSILLAETDSIADAALAYLNDNSIGTDTIAKTLRKVFGNKVKVQRVIAAKGDNAVVDYAVYGGPRPEATNKWKAYRKVDGEVLDTPKSVEDVKSQVSVDYQKQLEDEWIKKLRKKYPVKINKKVLKMVK